MSRYLDANVDGQPDLASVVVGKSTDARNRALRTLAWGLLTDIVAALVLLLLPVFSSASGWSSFDWDLMLFLVLKTVAVSALSGAARLLRISPNTTTV